MKKIIYMLSCLVFLFSLSYGSSWEGRSGNQLLKINFSPASMALGGGYVAGINGVYALSFNPAGITSTKRREAVFSHIELFDGVRTEYVAYGQKLWGIWFAAEVKGYYYSLQTFNNADVAGDKISIYNLAPAFGLAFKLGEHISIGASVSSLYENYGKNSANGDTSTFNFGVNAGIKLSLLNDTLRIGGDVRNIGFFNTTYNLNTPSNETIPYPLIGNAGVAYVFKNDELKDKVIINADVEIPYDNDMTFSGGVTFYATDSISLMAGYRYLKDFDTLDCFSFGIKVGENVKRIYGALEYAYVPYGEMGGTHHISYTIDF